MKILFLIATLAILYYVGDKYIYPREKYDKRHSYYNDYKLLSKEDSLNKVITSFFSYRGVPLITFEDSSKYKIGYSANYDYEPKNICDLIQRGDLIFKSKSNDTIRLKRDDITYIFVLDKNINPKLTFWYKLWH